MGLNIGRLLYGIRTKYEMNVKDICRGICSPSSYCMYENGEIVPDILLVNMFLDRMGFGILGLTAYISEKEVVYFKWKESTRACIRNENYKKLVMLLEHMPTGNVSLNKKIREQYAWFIKGIVAEKDTADLKKATECYEKALECTCGFLIKSQKIEGTFSVREIHIYAIYLNLLCKVNPKEKEEVISRFYQLMQYVNVHYVEEQQKVKIYPLLVCLWGNLVIEGKDTEGSFEIFEKTLELLRKQKSLYCLLEIMRLHILVGLKEKRDMSKEQEDIKILQSFFEEFGYQAQSQIYVPQANEIMLEHVGQYLSTERKKVNYTQEKISDGICSVESYSRIENGRKPTRNNYKALTEKIGTENRYYIELVNTGNIDALLLRREISYELFMEKNERLPELLEELKTVLGEKEVAKNRQYLEFVQVSIEENTGRKTWNQCCDMFRNILSYTMNEKEIGKKRHVYTMLEINLIDHISVCMAKDGKSEEAMHLIKAFLDDMDYMKTEKYYETFLAKLNYARWKSDRGNFDEAECIYREGIEQRIRRNKTELLDEYIGEYAYNKYLKNNINEKQDVKRYLLYALVLSRIYGTQRVYKTILQFFKKINEED
ncbi:XRE family transcriptional regulator [Roseburia inulinivorans]|jgi:transcriptional regulator with XRE-family HTH domain|uniref:XRE family transcriptional regulator n=2 Tax=Roseburia inulinivorans TaxID=360807 RepID=A0A414QN38_9FIRM|nr:XRE family transcriptional regulator [Roseburia inulinivorans]